MSPFIERQVISPACGQPATALGLQPMKWNPNQFSALIAISLLLSGCGLFGSSYPRKVTADADSITITNGRESDQREFAAGYCGSLNKSAMMVAPTPEDRRADAVRFACK